MRYITFEYNQQELVGALVGDQVVPLRAYSSMIDLIRAGGVSELPEERLNRADIRLLAPIPHPAQDVICLGMNFADHTEEAARFHPNLVRKDYAVYFSKRVAEALPDGAMIDPHFDVTSDVDYEAEVAVIIGKDAYKVSQADAEDYIFGYTILNDVSARDLQKSHIQFYFGKGLDTFTPIGPAIVSADEIPYPPELDIRCRINGELRQDGNTRQWIYNIAEVIEELSSAITLKAGTIIAMGTPAGVGMAFTPPKYLKSGDVIECEVEKLGVLTNTVM